MQNWSPVTIKWTRSCGVTNKEVDKLVFRCVCLTSPKTEVAESQSKCWLQKRQLEKQIQ